MAGLTGAERHALEREVVSIAQQAVNRAVATKHGLRERLRSIGTNEPVPPSRKVRWADQLARDAGDALRTEAAMLEDQEAEQGGEED